MDGESSAARPGEQAKATPINVPLHYASSISAALIGNDFFLMFARPHPAHIEGLKPGESAAIGEPVVGLYLSPATMKDLYLATKDQIEQYEKVNGTIQSDYARQVASRK